MDDLKAIETVVPWKGDGEYDPKTQAWTLECPFCDYTATFRGKQWAQTMMRAHGNEKHYDIHSGMYRNDQGLRDSASRMQHYRMLMGDEETVNQMNREGL